MAYPNTLDNLTNVNPGDLIDAAHENVQSAAINAIEVALGTLPFGPYATVAAAIAGKLDNYYAVDTGSANAYVVTLSPAPTSYTAGLTLRFKAVNANTTASTVNVNSLGTKTIKKNGTLDLVSGDIAASQVIEVVYDGTNFQIIGGPGGNPMTTLGDLIYGAASGVETRLAGDTSNTRKFLREQSSGGVAAAPAWDTIQAGDIPSTLNATTFSGQITSNSMLDVAAGLETVTASKTTAYTLVTSDNTIFADATSSAFNITTPSTVNVGQRFRIYKIDSSSHAVSIVANAGQTVSGITSISSQWQGLELVAETSTQWICNLLPVYNASAYTAGTGLTLSGSQFSLTTPVSLANGGTNASLTAALGAIPYCTASAIALLAPTSTAAQMLQSGANAAPTWSTAAWPSDVAANDVLYGSSAHTVGRIAASASSVFVTNASSVPAWATDLPAGTTIGGQQIATGDDLPNKYITDQNITMPANSNLIIDDVMEVGSNFAFELASGAILDVVYGILANPENANVYITTSDVALPVNSNLIMDDFLEVGANFAFEPGIGAILDIKSNEIINPMTAANDLTVGGAAGAPMRLATVASSFLGTDGSGNVSWQAPPSGGSSIYGDGSTGSATLTTQTLAGTNYYSSLTINASNTITAPYPVFCNGTATINGALSNDGGAGGNASLNTGGTAGAAPATGRWGGYTTPPAGVAGVTGNDVTGNNGVTPTSGTAVKGVSNASSGGGGNAGNVNGGTSATGGTLIGPPGGEVPRTPYPLINGGVINSSGTSITYCALSASGGSGATEGPGTGASGGSGAGGGMVFVALKTIAGTGQISANGGAAGTSIRGTSTAVGGSGSGGGGYCMAVYATSSLNPQASAGASSSGSGGGGGNGGTGSAGTVVALLN